MTGGELATAIGVALLLAGVSWVRRDRTAGPATTLVRALFPAWRFFERVEATPLLLCRAMHGEAAGPWIPAIPAAPRPWSAMLFNPRGTMLLAAHAALDRLVEDLAEHDGIELEAAERLVSYAVVLDLVRALQAWPPGAHFQLRMLLVQHAADRDTLEDVVFTSPAYEP